MEVDEDVVEVVEAVEVEGVAVKLQVGTPCHLMMPMVAGAFNSGTC